jgi:hypothetical protein
VLKSLWNKVAAAGLRVAKQVCLLAGMALVALATSAILVPFALGVAFLMFAKWAADRETEEAPLVVVPVGAY